MSLCCVLLKRLFDDAKYFGSVHKRLHRKCDVLGHDLVVMKEGTTTTGGVHILALGETRDLQGICYSWFDFIGIAGGE